MADTTQAAQKNSSSSGRSRAKPIPRENVRTAWRAGVTRHATTHDGGFLLAIEAGTKLEPRRFFALVVVVLGER